MKIAVAALVLAAVPAHAAQDRYAGYYSRDCGQNLVCDLRIEPTGRDTWNVAFSAGDKRDPSNESVCTFSTTAAIGEAAMGPMAISGIAVGRVGGRAFGIFDLGYGRVSWSSTWQACPGIAPKGIYSAVGG